MEYFAKGIKVALAVIDEVMSDERTLTKHELTQLVKHYDI